MAESFEEAVRRPDSEINLAEAALWVARDIYPNIDVARYLSRLDLHANALKSLPIFRSRPHPEMMPVAIASLNDYLFGEMGFGGNTGDYYDPRNSYLNEVLDRRLGIPITLSIVYLEIAWRLDLPLAGAGLPGHFMVTWSHAPEPFIIDVYSGGRILDLKGCSNRLAELFQQPVRVEPSWLEPVSRRYILSRMLNNLKGAFLRLGLVDRAIHAVEQVLLLNPEAAEEVRDLGLLYAQTGQRWSALRRLEEYLGLRPEAPDAGQVRHFCELLFDELSGKA